MNVFWLDSITMVPEWNLFIFMHPRWPPEAVTKNSTNTKMTISQEPLVEIDPTLCKNVSYMKPFCFLSSLLVGKRDIVVTLFVQCICWR